MTKRSCHQCMTKRSCHQCMIKLSCHQCMIKLSCHQCITKRSCHQCMIKRSCHLCMTNSRNSDSAKSFKKAGKRKALETNKVNFRFIRKFICISLRQLKQLSPSSLPPHTGRPQRGDGRDERRQVGGVSHILENYV